MCSPCLCTLSASAFIRPPIPTSGRFLLEIFLNFACLLCGAAHALAVNCASSAHVHRQMASNSYYTLPPRSSPQKNAGGKSSLRSKQSTKAPSPENSLATGGSFGTQHLSHYSARLVEERKKEWRKVNDTDFWLFLVSLPEIPGHGANFRPYTIRKPTAA